MSLHSKFYCSCKASENSQHQCTCRDIKIQDIENIELEYSDEEKIKIVITTKNDNEKISIDAVYDEENDKEHAFPYFVYDEYHILVCDDEDKLDPKFFRITHIENDDNLVFCYKKIDNDQKQKEETSTTADSSEQQQELDSKTDKENEQTDQNIDASENDETNTQSTVGGSRKKKRQKRKSKSTRKHKRKSIKKHKRKSIKKYKRK